MIKESRLNQRLALGAFSVILLLLMHISIPNMGGTVAHPREYLVWIGIFTIMLLGAVNTISSRRLILPSYLKYFIAYIALILSTSLFNPILSSDIFLLSLMRLIAALLIWMSFHQLRFSTEDKDSLLLIILTSSVIESVLVISKALISTYHLSLMESSIGYTLIRAMNYIPQTGGAFQQKNLFASWAATGIAISLYFIAAERFKGFTKSSRYIFFISLLLLGSALVLASSRAGLLGAALSAAVLLASGFNRYSTLKKQLAVWALIFAIGAGLGLYISGLKSGGAGSIKGTETEVMAKAKWLSDTNQRSFKERLIMYDTSFEMFKESPIFGQGFSNFSSTFMYFKAKVSQTNPTYKGMVYNEFISHPHNELLYILAESGIAGILAVIAALSGFALVLFRMGRSRAGTSIALFIPVTIHMMVEYPLKLSTAHYFLFLILLYIATSTDTKEKKLPMNRKLTAAAIISVTLLYLGISAYTVKTYIDYDKYSDFKLLYMNTGIIDERGIKPATKNIYLRYWAIPDLMYRKALTASYEPSKNSIFINEFLLWNEDEKIRRPAKPSYNLEALIFLNMARRDKVNPLGYLNKAKKAAEDGLRLYPNDGDLRRLKNDIYNYAIYIIPKARGRKQ